MKANASEWPSPAAHARHAPRRTLRGEEVRRLLRGALAATSGGLSSWWAAGAAHQSWAAAQPLAVAAPHHLVLAVLAAAASLLAAGATLAVVAAMLSGLPGAAGRVAAGALDRTTPIAVRAMTTALLGVGAGAVLAGAPAAPAAQHGPRTSQPISWHELGNCPALTPASNAAVLGDEPARSSAPADGATPTPSPPRGVPQHLDPDFRPRPAPAAVVVRPGDTLWGIAASGLGPDADDAAVASEWPRWYAANRHVVGDDPDLIHPGDRLRPPGSDSGPAR